MSVAGLTTYSSTFSSSIPRYTRQCSFGAPRPSSPPSSPASSPLSILEVHTASMRWCSTPTTSRPASSRTASRALRWCWHIAFGRACTFLTARWRVSDKFEPQAVVARVQGSRSRPHLVIHQPSVSPRFRDPPRPPAATGCDRAVRAATSSVSHLSRATRAHPLAHTRDCLLY